MKQKLTPSQRVAIWRKNNPEKRKRQWLKEWETRKNDSEKHKSWLIKKRVWDKKYRSTHEIKQTPYNEWKEEWKKQHQEYNKKWVKKNPEKRRTYDKKAKNKQLFGGLREVVILRDSSKCVKCGITREEHYKKYKRDITVDHKNRQGHGVEEKDNRLENMETLCISCHMKKDGSLNAKGIK